ncbi:Tex family protein [Alicyclobacillus cycloheptanicus]|uniref:S1 motif domain-containing protein n=1 Tax=Alicyclobacillus cycloheptanicus TaxID=1457 RepID=A0ABT9XM71_9BACL|nr:Tex family protein [Alicyclobacillus cycloheptanicus]MDQ0191385.1 uncharacterized protein [Alicyclobacillus cycloheptanicus]
MHSLQSPDYSLLISRHAGIRVQQASAAIRLLEEGNTIPFIARYRKEMTGELDENQLRDIAQRYEFEKTLYARKTDVLRLLEEQGVLADEELASNLLNNIASASTLTEVEDIYRPYRPKRKTRASVAKARGLEPLAAWLLQAAPNTPQSAIEAQAAAYVSPDQEVPTVEDALQGALDILAEQISDDAKTRQLVRSLTLRKASLRSAAVDPDAVTVYQQYYDYTEPLRKVPPHRILAMNRGEREAVLKVSIVAPQEEILSVLTNHHIGMYPVPDAPCAARYRADAVADAYKRLIAPAVEREIRADLTERAEAHAIQIFGQNLRSLLLQPPLRKKRVLGVDPAYRTGCKLAAVDDTGKLLEVAVIYPTPPQNKVQEATETVLQLLARHELDVIAIGNGTASRETEAFIADCVRAFHESSDRVVPYLIVSEAGASVYSASPLAGEEFPDLDVSERSAISIARRVQDPLAELVKIDPQSVGVGQYQHDVSQKELAAQLRAVVESAVNQVGVDVNTASPSLLAYVSGLTRSTAKNIVAFREQNGRFRSRAALAQVPRMGPKTLEQCVGFLRIPDGDNVLDATPIHPESYPVVEQLLARTGRDAAVLRNPPERSAWLAALQAQPLHELAADLGVGAPTLRDILEALERPGRDPREDVAPPVLRTDVMKLEDIAVGMELAGTVRNVVDFGAFVDVGVKNDGLVHISELSDSYVRHPMDVVSVGDVVQVRVIQIDLVRGRLGLSMKRGGPV